MSTPRDNIEAKLGFTGPPLQKLREAPPQIPDHEMVRRIGQGAYGEVWLARNALGTCRAVKIVHREDFRDARPYEREFAGIRRFEPLSRSNEGFVDILQVGREDAGGWFYYVMELADNANAECGVQSADLPLTRPSGTLCPTGGEGRGEAAAEKHKLTPHSTLEIPHSYTPRTLAHDLHERARLPLEDCLQLGLTLTLALGHLHRHGLIHRDVKPSNIIYVGDVPKLADIGLVTEAQGANTFVGTEGFVPPEGPTSPKADLYALGKVLYEAAMGKDRHEFPEPFTQISTDRESIALMELNAVLLRACAPDPRKRYATAEEMHADLALLHSGGSVKRRHQFNRQFRIAKQVGAGAVGLAALASALYLWQSHHAKQMTLLAIKAHESEQLARQHLYAADINLAQQAVAADNLRQARKLLEGHAPKPGESDQRGFEWHLLAQQAQGDELCSLPGHAGGAWRVAFSPDGKRLATSGADKSVRIWDLDSLREIARFVGQREVLSLSFSPTQDFLAAGSFEKVSIWDLRSFTEVRELPGATGPALFSPDGSWMLTLSVDRLLLWETAEWRLTGSLERPKPRGWRFACTFAPHGDLFAVTVEGGIAFISVPDLKPAGMIAKRQSERPFMAFSPDDRTLATDDGGFGVTLWDYRQCQPLLQLQGHRDHIYAARFSPDGKRLVTASPDQTIRVWETATGRLMTTLRGQADEVFDVAYSPDGKLLASVGVNDGLVKLWNASALVRPDHIRDSVRPLGFDSHSQLVGLSGNKTFVRVAPSSGIITGSRGPSLTTGRAWTPFLGQLASDGRTLALWDAERRETEVWDWLEPTRQCRVDATSPWVRHAHNHRWLLTRTGPDTTTIWQLPGGEQRWVLTNASPEVVTISPDERHLVSDQDNHLRLWQIEGDRLIPAKDFNPKQVAVAGAAFSPDGRFLATAQEGALIRLWAMPEGREIGVLSGHTRLVTSVTFSPDGRTLASICDDRTVRLWHVATRRELLRFESEREDRGPFGLMFSPDGSSLVASRLDDEGPITWIWSAPDLTSTRATVLGK